MKKLLLKLGVGTIAVVLLQFRLGGVLEYAPCVVRDAIDAQIRAGARTLVLGDSVQAHVQMRDREHRSLAMMLDDRLPPNSLIQVYSLAYAAEVHRDAAAYAFRSGVPLEAVVVGINMRSFGPLWDQRPAFQFSAQNWRLRYGDFIALGLHRPMASYHVYAALEGYPPTEAEFYRRPLFWDGKPQGSVGDVIVGRGCWQDVPLSRRSAPAMYLPPLDAGHRKVRALAELAADCRRHRTPVLFYVSPVNVDACEAATGEDFRRPMARQIEVLRGVLEAQGAEFKDLSLLLPPADFYPAQIPDEHLQEAGRHRLLEILVPWIRAHQRR